MFSTACVAVPVVCLPTIAKELSNPDRIYSGDVDCPTCSGFSAQIASYATAGTALGKFFLGFLGDAIGARRTMMLCFLAMLGSQILLSVGHSTFTIGVAQMLLEFFNSVNWPCMTIVISTHYLGDLARLDGAIFILGLSSRIGALVSMPSWGLLETYVDWRTVAGYWGSGVALAGFILVALFIKDTPTKRDEPQGKSLSASSVFSSLKNVFSSRMFWLVAGAQVGNGMVRTSERVLGTFFSETTDVSDATGGALTTFLSAGLLFGVLVFGAYFVKSENKYKKRIILTLYIGCIVFCVLLAGVSLDRVRDFLGSYTIYVEVTVTFFMAAFVGTQYYQIPPTVASTFGADKGLCSSYIDGIGYFAASGLWSLLSFVVDNMGDYGWTACWLALACIVLVAALLNRRLLSIFPLYNSEPKSDATEELLSPEEKPENASV
jgi:MFS family permease